MDQASLEHKLKELAEHFGPIIDTQDGKLTPLGHQPDQGQKKLRETTDTLQESLDYLRICIKYHIFDLEATRRENKYLRKLLEENS